MEWISAQPPIWRLHSIDPSHPPGNPQEKCTTCLTSPLPRVTYQVYCNTYKTHAMAICHGGAGKCLDRDAMPNGKDTDANILHDYHNEDTDDFENVE